MRRTYAILIGGTIAGAIDITYAIVFTHFRGITATRLLQSVASGLLGSSAYHGGLATVAIGLTLHFLIALIWAALFGLASARLPVLTRRAFIAGPVYGLAIYAFMNLVVLPLSAFPHPVVFRPLAFTTGILVHMFGIGLPIALSLRRPILSSGPLALSNSLAGPRPD